MFQAHVPAVIAHDGFPEAAPWRLDRSGTAWVEACTPWPSISPWWNCSSQRPASTKTTSSFRRRRRKPRMRPASSNPFSAPAQKASSSPCFCLHPLLARRQPVSVHRIRQDRQRGEGRRRGDEKGLATWPRTGRTGRTARTGRVTSARAPSGRTASTRSRAAPASAPTSTCRASSSAACCGARTPTRASSRSTRPRPRRCPA